MNRPRHSTALFANFVTSFVIAACLMFTGCHDSESKAGATSPSTRTEARITDRDWQRAAMLRIVFAHQSVGNNILSGIDTLSRDHTLLLRVEASTAPLSTPGLHHFLIGTNGDPLGKIEAFKKTMRGGLGESADIAVLKLCFSDFAGDSDANALADRYIAALEKLSAELPQTRFIPVTVPLTTAQSGPRAWIKKLIGRDPGGYVENFRRTEFNERLRRHYGSTGLLFDLAALESADGSIGVEYQGHRVETLSEDWTDDGGHLNVAAQSIVARAFLEHLANVGRP